MANDVEPVSERSHIQKAWDRVVIIETAKFSSSIDQARVLAAVSAHTGNWLHAAPISSIGLRLSNEAIHVAVGHRLRTNTCQPHECPCDKQVDARGLHSSLVGKQLPDSSGTLTLTLTRSNQESVGLFRSDGKRQYGATQIPWATGKPLAWDVPAPDTYADSIINSTSITAGAAANHAATVKSAKNYANLTSTHIFVPFVIETSGAWNAQAIDLTQEIGRRTTAVTGDPLETIHLFQRLSIYPGGKTR